MTEATGLAAGPAGPVRAVEVVRVHRGRYHDSVTLLWASAAARDVDGVEAAIVAMGTDMNRDLLVAAGFGDPDATADDLVVAVRCVSDDTADVVVATVEQVLTATGRGVAGRTGDAGAVAPHTVEAAAARAPEAGVVLVSVPGRHAYVEAMAALRAGCHVMVFSDGVDDATEVRLKREAARLGRLVMGPDCGTVILDGVGLGFANAVAPGPVALVAASGTGAQQVCCLLDAAGIGVRHVVGVGGRDLSPAVGGLSTRAALVALDADPAVEVIGVVAKAADPAVRATIAATAEQCRTPVVSAIVGPGQPTLTDAAAAIAERLGRPFPEPGAWPATADGPDTDPPPGSPSAPMTAAADAGGGAEAPLASSSGAGMAAVTGAERGSRPAADAGGGAEAPLASSSGSGMAAVSGAERGSRPAADAGGGAEAPAEPASAAGAGAGARAGALLGLFSGGTNAAEALVVLEDQLGPVRSNVHHDPARLIGPDDDMAGASVVLDLGDDQLTAGRPHPMIDPAVVAERLGGSVAARSAVSGDHGARSGDGPAVVLLDVVLGHGAHPDPAAVLAPAVARVVGVGVPVVVTLVGADGDPQGLDRQAQALVAAGAVVHRSNARAAAHAAALATADRRPGVGGGVQWAGPSAGPGGDDAAPGLQEGER